ncbi:MAG: hypothetical protein GXX79_17860 [Actinomycetales bacterium]|nr:hypothetical protein [Actinomycetales bacterium]
MSRRIALLAAGLAACGSSVLPASPATAADSCRVDYAVVSQWSTGFQASVTLVNTGSAWTSWTLGFTFPDQGQRVSQGWSASWSQTGAQVTASGLGWNSSVATNQSITLGFVGAHNGANPSPTGFSVNGAACTGGGQTSTTRATTTRTTTTTTTTRSTTTTTTTVSPSTNCPASGRITYTLARDASSADALEAYRLITSAMDQAVAVYNCHTNITKQLYVTYNPSVATADGNINGSIRFGSRASMQQITAMHEISHTLGVGTSSAWAPRLSNGVWTGSAATNQLRAITGDPSAAVHGDRQHFWPYGLNYTSEVSSSADLVNHCRMVVALRQDMGL